MFVWGDNYVIVNLRELAGRDGPLELHGTFVMPDLESDGIRFEQPVVADLSAEWDAGAAKVTGTLTATMNLVCSKCLKKFTERHTFPVDEMFTQQRSIADEDEDIHLVDDERVDVTPHLQESLLVQLPYAPTCSADCKGLCPVCGTDRNTHSCDCEHVSLDPRLAGLKDFFKQ